MEWRDVSVALLGIVITLIGFAVTMVRSEMSNHVLEDRRRLDEHGLDISKLFSAVNDEKVQRLEAHIVILTAQNKNQSDVMSTLAAITARSMAHENGNK